MTYKKTMFSGDMRVPEFMTLEILDNMDKPNIILNFSIERGSRCGSFNKNGPICLYI